MPFGVARGMDRTAGAAAGEQVVHFADRDNGRPAPREQVEQRIARRVECIVVAVGGPFERAGRADERTRDDAPDTKSPARQVEGNLADAVQLRDGNHVLMGGDLKDAVGGRVDNRLARPDVLLTEPVDDLGAGGHDVTDVWRGRCAARIPR